MVQPVGNYYAALSLYGLPIRQMTIAACGDSIPLEPRGIFYTTQNSVVTAPLGIDNSDSIVGWACAYSGGRLIQTASNTNGGWTSVNVLQNFNAIIAPTQPRFVFMAVGYNDLANGAGNAPALRTNLINMINQINNWGGVTILCTIAPIRSTAGGYSTAIRNAAMQHNEWVRFYATANAQNIIMFDLANFLTNPSNSAGDPYLASASTLGCQSDPPHPNGEMRRALGYELWNNVLTNYTHSSSPLLVSQYTTQAIFANTGLTGTGGNLSNVPGTGNTISGTLPNNTGCWCNNTNSAATVTYTAGVASTDYATSAYATASGASVLPNWVQCQVSGTTTVMAGSTGYFGGPVYGIAFQTSGVAFAAGDIVTGRCEIVVTAATHVEGVGACLYIPGGVNTYTTNMLDPGSSGFSPAVSTSNEILTVGTNYSIVFPDLVIQAADAGTIAPQMMVGALMSATNGSVTFKVRRVEIFKRLVQYS